MHPFRLALAVSAIALVSLLTAAGPADAALFRGRSVAAYRPDRDHMPGWDSRYIYPWSPYNYGRNPYNPIIRPYPPPYYYGYGPYPPAPYYGPHNAAAPDGAMFPSGIGQPVQMPHPSGVLQTPPPGAAIIQVRVADESAHVLFDGERTYTEGTIRYFVTPDLPDGKTYHYTVSASWSQDGAAVTKERQIQASAGHTTIVDFVQPAGK